MLTYYVQLLSCKMPFRLVNTFGVNIQLKRSLDWQPWLIRLSMRLVVSAWAITQSHRRFKQHQKAPLEGLRVNTALRQSRVFKSKNKNEHKQKSRKRKKNPPQRHNVQKAQKNRKAYTAGRGSGEKVFGIPAVSMKRRPRARRPKIRKIHKVWLSASSCCFCCAAELLQDCSVFYHSEKEKLFVRLYWRL